MSTYKEIYLDENATTRVLPLAAQEAYAVMEECFGNPSSSHITGLRARQILESARSVARDVLGAPQGKIVFTSGATEAIQTGIFSALCQIKENPAASKSGLLLYGATEHKAVPQALDHWNRLLDIGYKTLAVPVDSQGQLDFDFLREHIQSAHMLCTMAVNNETGAIHDLRAIEEVVRTADHPVAWMVDSVQAIGKMPLDYSDFSIDYATFSGHKIYAPKGIGLLYVREGAPFTPLLAGGGQEGGARGGTENLPGVAAIAAILKAIRDRNTGLFRDKATLLQFRDRLLASLERAFPNIQYNTPFEKAVPTTINFAVPSVTGKEILDLFDAAGIRVSSGSACGSATLGSYVLEAMGMPKWQSDSAIRISFGPATTSAEIDAACIRIEEAGEALKKSCVLPPRPQSVAVEQRLDGLVQLKHGSDCSWIFADVKSMKCVIVDPFEELMDRIETMVACQQLQVVAILDTHQHVDHKSPRELLAQRLAKQHLYESKPTDILGWPENVDGQLLIGDNSKAPMIQLSNSMAIAKTPLPGHTVDGQAFLVGRPRDGCLNASDVRFAFTGDTLLIGGIGRTDFESSAAEAMFDSLRKLPTLVSAKTVICPTHDYNLGFITTLASEQANNQLLSQILDPAVAMSVTDYLSMKRKVDAEIDDQANCELVCGRIQNYTDNSSHSIDVEPSQLKEFFQQHKESLLVDVREPHEFHFAQDWESLGLDSPPRNVPLTRLAQFLSDVLSQNHFSQEIVFLCRSGNRSGKAACAVRRLGIPTAWHIAGGIALGMAPSHEFLAAEELEYSI